MDAPRTNRRRPDPDLRGRPPAPRPPCPAAPVTGHRATSVLGAAGPSPVLATLDHQLDVVVDRWLVDRATAAAEELSISVVGHLSPSDPFVSLWLAAALDDVPTDAALDALDWLDRLDPRAAASFMCPERGLDPVCPAHGGTPACLAVYVASVFSSLVAHRLHLDEPGRPATLDQWAEALGPRYQLSVVFVALALIASAPPPPSPAGPPGTLAAASASYRHGPGSRQLPARPAPGRRHTRPAADLRPSTSPRSPYPPGPPGLRRPR